MISRKILDKITDNSINRIFIFFIILILVISFACSSGDKKDSALKKVITNLNGEPVIPRQANTIYITPFFNLTNINSLQDKLYLKLKEQINMDGRLAVTQEKNQSDLSIEGIILDYQIQPVKYSNTGEIITKRIRISASVKMTDLKKNVTILYERGIQSFDTFSETELPIYSENQIQDKVIGKLAERITLKIIDGWYTKLLTPVEKGKK